jgi:hypothetical protein
MWWRAGHTTGHPPTVADVVFEQLKAAVHPIEAKCARGERLDALVVAFKALCANAGEDWAMFSPDHRPYLMLCVAVVVSSLSVPVVSV